MRALTILLLSGVLAVGLSLSSPARAQTFSSTVWEFDRLTTDDEFSPPGRYTIEFLSDGSVEIEADCNHASGRWSAEQGTSGGIDITITLQSVSGCSDSFESTYLDWLDAVDTFSMSTQTLTLSNSHSSSQAPMVFRPAGA